MRIEGYIVGKKDVRGCGGENRVMGMNIITVYCLYV